MRWPSGAVPSRSLRHTSDDRSFNVESRDLPSSSAGGERTHAGFIRPVSESEVRLGALDWLEEEHLPSTIRQYFVDVVETVLKGVVPSLDWPSLRGCGDATKYRAAYRATVQRGEFQR
jgi:hypothetical protein